MTRSLVRQNTQVRSSGEYDDTLPAGASLETVEHLEGDLNAVRSQIRRITGQDHWYDDPGDVGSVLTEAEHKVIRHLAHYLVDAGPAITAYRQILPAGDLFPTSDIWYEDAGHTKKAVEKLMTWTGIFLTQVELKLYDVDGGPLLVTMMDTITYTGVQESSRDRVVTYE